MNIIIESSTTIIMKLFIIFQLFLCTFHNLSGSFQIDFYSSLHSPSTILFSERLASIFLNFVYMESNSIHCFLVRLHSTRINALRFTYVLANNNNNSKFYYCS